MLERRHPNRPSTDLQLVSLVWSGVGQPCLTLSAHCRIARIRQSLCLKMALQLTVPCPRHQVEHISGYCMVVKSMVSQGIILSAMVQQSRQRCLAIYKWRPTFPVLRLSCSSSETAFSQRSFHPVSWKIWQFHNFNKQINKYFPTSGEQLIS